MVVLVVLGDLDMVVPQTEVETLVIQVLAVPVVLVVPTAQVVLEGLVVPTVQVVLEIVPVVLGTLVEIAKVALVTIILAGLETLGKTVQVVLEGFDQNAGRRAF